MLNFDKIAVLGAGNGGQAIAAALALKGFRVQLWNRSPQRLEPVAIQGGINIEGELSGFGRLHLVTNDLAAALNGVTIVMVVTTADAHRELARACSPFLQDGQIVILNPGRTGGALEFRHILEMNEVRARVFVAEAHSLIYACRIVGPAVVRIIGVKRSVPLAALPAIDTPYVLEAARQLFDGFVGASDVLETGLENIGAIFHPAIALLNAVRIEAGASFLFYQSMTPGASLFLEQLDRERIAIGESMGFDLTSARDWISQAYQGVKGDTLYARIRSNPAYDGIKAPTSLNTRLFNEDVPTGLIPMAELARITGTNVRLCKAMVDVCSALCQKDFWKCGRTLDRLGIEGMTQQDLLDYVRQGKGK